MLKVFFSKKVFLRGEKIGIWRWW